MPHSRAHKLTIKFALIAMAISAGMLTHAAQLPHTFKLKSIAPENHQFDDLAPVGRAVGNAQLVVLGEQTHGEGDVYSLKVRLVEYLHEVKGFNVLVMESGLFDGTSIGKMSTDGKDLLDNAPDNIFFVYSKTVQARPIFSYLDGQRKAGTPMAFASFDSQHSGKLSQSHLVDQLGEFLTRSGSVLPQSDEWRNFKELSQPLFAFNRTAPPAAAQDSYFHLVDQAFICLGTNDKPELVEQSAYWRRVVASLRSQATRFWKTGSDSMADLNLREEASADNLLWLMRQVYPGKKMIIWTHDVHGQKAALYPGIKGAMQRVREQMPESRFYHAYFTAYSGDYTDYLTGATVHIGEHGPHSLESTLHGAGYNYGFVDLLAKGTPLRHRLLDGNDRTFPTNRVELGDFADGVFYIDTMHPTVREKGFEN